MIRLYRPGPPAYLTPAKVAELTAEFLATHAAVWNRAEIKIPLLELTCGKCAYCECDVGEESKYMEVEHFRDKVRHPSKVVEWDNLLPSCKRCNGAKSNHDVDIEPIIDPFAEEPGTHLRMR